MSDFLMSLKDVTLAFGGPRILDGVSISISKGLRAALTGRNGEGKSTLMKVIAGALEPDGGEIVRAPNLKVVYVGQGVEDEPASPVDAVSHRVREDAASFPVDAVSHRVREVGSVLIGRDEDIASTGRGKDSASTGRGEPPRPHSGGEIRRARLEEALLSHPDLLLLDEPTNHLDVEAIDWLEGMIRRAREMAVLIVTHDRRFLKRVAQQIFDLDRGELSGWPCDYATFVKRKADLMADEAVYWERKSKKLAQEEAWIRRGVKARTTRNEGRVAALKKLRAEFAARRTQVGTASLKIDTAAPGGVRVLKIENLGFSYVSRPIVSHFTADVLRGERIGILGGNGAGKTTLLKLLTGQLQPTEGSVTIGTNVKMAFFDQLRTELNLELTVGENVASDRDEVVVGGVKKHIYSYLADFLFTPERVRTPVKALSGGERARLLLAKLFMTPANLLVMDEPTNDLDIETLELLEEQLLAYKGTLLLVSHDREFLDNVVTSTFVLEGDGEVRCYPGGWEDYLRQRPVDATSRRVPVDAKSVRVPVDAVSSPRQKADGSGLIGRDGDIASTGRGKDSASTGRGKDSASTGRDGDIASTGRDGGIASTGRGETPRLQKKLSYNEKRELEALPEKIEALEKEVAEIRAALADGTIYRADAARAQQLTARLAPAEAELEAAVDRWASLEERNSASHVSCLMS